MTCAGLLGLAVAHAMPGNKAGKNPLKDQAIQHGLTALARSIDRPNEDRPLDLYFLWSLERVGVLFQLPKIDGKDWYAWGRRVLRAKQQGDGSWTESAYYGHNPIINTCFALLFLKQANLAVDLTDKLLLLAGGAVEVPGAARKED